MRRSARGAWGAIVLGAMSFGVSLHAAEDVTSRLKETLEQRFPKIKIDVVQPAPVPGLYEIIASNNVVYADATGDYLITGRMMDTRTREDLSGMHLDAHNTVDFHKLPFDQAIKIVRGNGRQQLALFEDPDCPYCQQLEKALRTVTDLTVYVFLLPLEDVHPNATAHAHAIWCSPDRSTAWTEWMLERKQPTPDKCSADPIEPVRTLAASLHIQSTPTLVLENGRRISGSVPTEQLLKLLAEGAGSGVAKTADVTDTAANPSERPAKVDKGNGTTKVSESRLQ